MFIGRPLYFMELSLGQFSSSSNVKVEQNMTAKMEVNFIYCQGLEYGPCCKGCGFCPSDWNLFCSQLLLCPYCPLNLLLGCILSVHPSMDCLPSRTSGNVMICFFEHTYLKLLSQVENITCLSGGLALSNATNETSINRVKTM